MYFNSFVIKEFLIIEISVPFEKPIDMKLLKKRWKSYPFLYQLITNILMNAEYTLSYSKPSLF